MGILTLSALLTAFSETFYWYSGGTDYPFRVVVYLIPTTSLLWAASAYPALGWPAVVLVGSVYGFVTEGVLTPVVYGGFPLDPFTISYTSLGWHAIISVAVGLVLFHRVLAAGSRSRALGLIGLFGAFWAMWAMSLRLPPEEDDELAGYSALVGDVSVTAFALYTVAATIVVAGCHWILGRFIRAADLVPSRWWLGTVVVAGGLWFAVLVVPGVPWAPVELAALLWVCLWGLRRLPQAPADGSDDVLPVITERVPWRRLALLAALPVTAIAVYGALVGAELQDPTIRLVFRNGLVMLQAVCGWALFLWALRRAWRHRRRADTPLPARPV